MQNKIKNKDLEVYFNLMIANGASSLYRMSREMHLFDSFGPDDLFSAEEFALKHDFKIVPAKVLLETLASVGLLEQSRTDGTFSLSSVMNLLYGDYKNLSDDYWAHLPTLLKTGEPFKKEGPTSPVLDYQAQVKSHEWMMDLCAKEMMNILNIPSDSKPEILDVGGGSGVWSYPFLYNNKQATSTLVEWPFVMNIAKVKAEKNKVLDRVLFSEGNILEVTFESAKYHYALLGNVAHLQTPDGNKKLFQKIYDALLPGGSLIILDAFGTDERGELARSFYQMGLTIKTISKKVYSPEELKPWLQKAQFSSFEFHSLNVVPYSMGMLIAKKEI
ncbi:MAG: class I SAM-dependent methyltransferase [Bacteriovorax sp.]